MHLEARARQILDSLDSHLNASAYDVAWLARLTDDGSPRYPELAADLLDMQLPDGSWGSALPYYHDRILCTLSAIIALHERRDAVASAAAIRRGERFIWMNYPKLAYDTVELVGFELILPTLLADARALGLDVPMHSFGYGQIRDAKLRLMPIEAIYSPRPGMSIAFSLEFLGDNGSGDMMHRLQSANGSIACSPATTAYYAQRAGLNSPASAYLDAMRARRFGVPPFYPFQIFEAAWVLEHLSFGGFDLETLVDSALWQTLASALTPTGAGMDPNFGIHDGDTTSVTMRALCLGGHTVDYHSLHHFERADTRIFRTIAFERNLSMTTNAHGLEALELLPDYPDRETVREAILEAFLTSQVYQTYWVDKWHSSPLYATSHILIALMNAGEYHLIEQTNTIQWLIHTQRSDGSWGHFADSTVEETAYALLALLYYHRQVAPVPADIFHRAAAYLSEHITTPDRYPAMWIAKTLYTPHAIIEAAILAVVALYEDTFSRLLEA